MSSNTYFVLSVSLHRMIDSTDGSAKSRGDDLWYFSLYKFGGKPYYFIEVYLVRFHKMSNHK